MQYSPTGLVSKNKIGALKIAVSILLCKLRDAAKMANKHSTVLIITASTENETIPPYIPILWSVERLMRDEVSFTSLGKQDSVSLALQMFINSVNTGVHRYHVATVWLQIFCSANSCKIVF